MSVSKKQLIANRQNAQLSTGPKTDEGKDIVSNNPVKHGLYAHDPVINSPAYQENQEEYDRLLASLLVHLSPKGLFEEYLVAKICNCLWRCRRAARAETAHINRQLLNIDHDVRGHFVIARYLNRNEDESATDDSEEAQQRVRSLIIASESIPDEHHALNILRYELRLDRQLTRAYQLLRQLQESRPANPGDDTFEKPKNDKTNPFPRNEFDDTQLP